MSAPMPGARVRPAPQGLPLALTLSLGLVCSTLATPQTGEDAEPAPGFGQHAEAREIVDRILGPRPWLDEAPRPMTSARPGAGTAARPASPVEQILGPSTGGGLDLSTAVRLEGSRALIAGSRADPAGQSPLMAPRLTSSGGGVSLPPAPEVSGPGHSGTLDVYDVLLRWTPIRPVAGSSWTLGVTAGLRAPVLELGPPTDPTLWPGSGAGEASTAAGLTPVVGGITAWDYAPGVALRASGESGVGSVVGWSSYAQIRVEHVWRLTSAGTFSVGYLHWRESFGEGGGPPAARVRRDALTLELRLGF